MANEKPLFEYPVEDLLNPQGINGLSSRAAFYQRSLYKDAIYPSERPLPLDEWYDKFLYGRVDSYQNSVILDSQHLTPIRSADTPNLMILKPVQRAFEKFTFHMKKALFVGAVSSGRNSRLVNVKAMRSYEAPTIRYEDFTQHLFNVFLRGLGGADARKIKDFNSFIKVYERYLLNMAAVTPLTKTNFMISQNTSLFSSGLSISIAPEDAGSDKVKYKDFINDPNFEFFRECAKKFGFILNKNAPWIMTADLFSSAFLEVGLGNFFTAEGDAITKDNFFDTFYRQTHLTDIEILATIFINSYKGLLQFKPFYDQETSYLRHSQAAAATLSALDSNCPVLTKERKALDLSVAQLLGGDAGGTDLNHKYLIDFYATLRNTEVGTPLNPKKMAMIKEKAYNAYNLRPNASLTPLQNAASYVNTVFRDYIYGRGATRLQKQYGGGEKGVDNRVAGGRILVESATLRQLY